MNRSKSLFILMLDYDNLLERENQNNKERREKKLKVV